MEENEEQGLYQKEIKGGKTQNCKKNKEDTERGGNGIKKGLGENEATGRQRKKKC